MAEPIVIVGGGVAGATPAVTLRERGYDGPLILLGRENVAPYERPLLSKRSTCAARPTRHRSARPSSGSNKRPTSVPARLWKRST